jgi:Zn-finger protein
MDHHEEFECEDCHCRVFRWPLIPKPESGIKHSAFNGDRCAVCQWIHDQPNLTEKEIAEIRLITATPILEKNDD